jgi:hypothetical protein
VAGTERYLRQLEQQCVDLCHLHGWLSSKATPNYRLIYSHPTTFQQRSPFMLLGINPAGESLFADVHPADLPYSRVGYSAYYDELWASRLQKVARDLASAVAGGTSDGERLLRSSPTGNMIPFRLPNFPSLPSHLKEEGIALGQSLISNVQPKLLVMLGGGEDLFLASSAAFNGEAEMSPPLELGHYQFFRWAVVAHEAGASHLAQIPFRAPQKGIATLVHQLRAVGVRI